VRTIYFGGGENGDLPQSLCVFVSLLFKTRIRLRDSWMELLPPRRGLKLFCDANPEAAQRLGRCAGKYSNLPLRMERRKLIP
jgi:hypothetical protein